MTLQEYYDALVKHDWYWGLSDDMRVIREGTERAMKLQQEAELDPEKMALYMIFCARVNENVEKGVITTPMPERPK